ncbi:MAG TPA: SAM-dependent methyltransferase [Candidatus Limnocylindrales bacterium]
MRADDWGQDGVDTDVPNVARMYDYYLGGLHNFPADREMAQRVVGAYPTLPAILRLNRAFLRRAVTYLANAGIRQFLDLGSGLPTIGNVHEVAQSVDPEAHVVYVDIDPTAVLHSRLMLVGNPYATVLQVDLRQPELVLNHRDLRWQIDLDQPVAILAISVLHFITDADDPYSLMKTYGSVLAPGSYLAISHATHDIEPEQSEKVMQLYARSGNPMQFRTHAEIASLFANFELVEPGLSLLDDWHPELSETDQPRLNIGYCGVARKR